MDKPWPSTVTCGSIEGLTDARRKLLLGDLHPSEFLYQTLFPLFLANRNYVLALRVRFEASPPCLAATRVVSCERLQLCKAGYGGYCRGPCARQQMTSTKAGNGGKQLQGRTRDLAHLSLSRLRLRKFASANRMVLEWFGTPVFTQHRKFGGIANSGG